MALRKLVNNLTKSEFEQLKIELNMTDEEEKIFDLIKKGKSNIQIADACCCSLATIGNRIAHIKSKMERLGKNERI